MSKTETPKFKIKELGYLFELSEEEIKFHLKRNISKMKLFVRDRNNSMPGYFELYYEYKVLRIISYLKYLETSKIAEDEYSLKWEKNRIKSFLLEDHWYSEETLNEYCEYLSLKYKSLTNLLDKVIFEGKEEELQYLEAKYDIGFYIYLILETNIVL